MLNYDAVRNFRFPEGSARYTARDASLYALSLGFGGDPLDARQLRYVAEGDQQVAPTMPVVFCHPGLWIKDPSLGMDWRKLVHADQRVTLNGALPRAAEVTGQIENVVVADRGEGRGAVIVQRRTLRNAADGNLLATVESTYLARGDGGFSGEGKSDPLPEHASAARLDRAPDKSCELAIPPNAALLYRLNGDLNPLHSDPAAAQAAGFPAPILHGLCTYGMAARGILEHWCDYRAEAMESLFARFSAPVYPGETLSLDMWHEGERMLFQATIRERDVVALKDGVAQVRLA